MRLQRTNRIYSFSQMLDLATYYTTALTPDDWFNAAAGSLRGWSRCFVLRLFNHIFTEHCRRTLILSLTSQRGKKIEFTVTSADDLEMNEIRPCGSSRRASLHSCPPAVFKGREDHLAGVPFHRRPLNPGTAIFYFTMIWSPPPSLSLSLRS